MTSGARGGEGPPARVWLLLFLSYGAFHAAFFGPVLFSSNWLAIDDSITNSVPDFAFLPTLWSGYAGGHPMASDPGTMTWYPPKLAGQMLLALGVMKAYDLFVISAYVFGSTFAHLYVHHLTRSHLAGAVGGLTYGLGSYMVSKVELPFLAHSAPWLPLLVLALDRLREGFHAGWFVAAALATALTVLAGHPQAGGYALIVGATFALALGWGANVGRWRYYGLALGAGLAGLALAAIQIVPSLADAPIMSRTSWSYGNFLSNALPPKHFLKLLFPFLLGGSHSRFYGVDYFGRDDFGETSVYAGILPLGLALLGLRLRGSASATAWFWAGWAVVSVLFAIGDAAPVARLAYQIPIVNQGRCPGRIFFVLNLGMAVLAGLGTAALESRRARPRDAGLAVAALGVIVGLAFAGALGLEEALRRDPSNPGRLAGISFWPTQNPATAVPLLLFIAAAAVLLLYNSWPPRVRPLAGALLVGLALVDLGSFAWFMEWKYKVADPVREFSTPAYAEKYRELLGRQHQRILTFGNHKDARSGLLPDRSRLWGLESVNVRRGWIYGPLMKAFLARREDDALAHPLRFDLMAIRYVLVMVLEEPDKSTPAPGSLAAKLLERPDRWRLVDRFGISWVFENRHALPRAWLVGRAVGASDEEMQAAFQWGKLPDGAPFDPRRVALVEGELDFAAPGFDPSTAGARVVEKRAMAMTVETNSRSPAFLVLSDNHFPGWRAEVDGRGVPIYRTNYLLRGVVVPAGRHIVRFIYRPASFTVGAGITAASFLGLGLLLALGGRSSRPRLV